MGAEPFLDGPRSSTDPRVFVGKRWSWRIKESGNEEERVQCFIRSDQDICLCIQLSPVLLVLLDFFRPRMQGSPIICLHLSHGLIFLIRLFSTLFLSLFVPPNSAPAEITKQWLPTPPIRRQNPHLLPATLCRYLRFLLSQYSLPHEP